MTDEAQGVEGGCERCETPTAGFENGGWICEVHRGAWPHDDCAGPGEPCPNCNPMARQALGLDAREAGDGEGSSIT